MRAELAKVTHGNPNHPRSLGFFNNAHEEVCRSTLSNTYIRRRNKTGAAWSTPVDLLLLVSSDCKDYFRNRLNDTSPRLSAAARMAAVAKQDMLQNRIKMARWQACCFVGMRPTDGNISPTQRSHTWQGVNS